MTKKELARAFINLFAIAENDKIAFGYSEKEAIEEVCKDAGITHQDYLKLCLEYLDEDLIFKP